MLNLKTIFASIALATGMTLAAVVKAAVVPADVTAKYSVSLDSIGLPTAETISYIQNVCYYHYNAESCKGALKTVFTNTELNRFWKEFHYQCLGKKSFYTFTSITVDCETAENRLADQGYSVDGYLLDKKSLIEAAKMLNKN